MDWIIQIITDPDLELKDPAEPDPKHCLLVPGTYNIFFLSSLDKEASSGVPVLRAHCL